MAPSTAFALNFLVIFFFYLLFALSHYSLAQQQKQENSTAISPAISPQQQKFDPPFKPSMAVLIVVLMTAFFFVAFFSIYIRQCGGGGSMAQRVGAPRARRRGIDRSVIDRLPTLLYSNVKGHRIGKHDSPLECAVCLSDFADSDLLRLIPHCSHAFHPDCIALWLSSHPTCPVCRHDFSSSEDDVASVHIDDDDPSSFDPPSPPPPPPPPPPPAHPHPPLGVWGEEERERRFTLRLPDHVRREVMEGRLNRSVSMVALPVCVGEGSTRRGGGGSSRGGRVRQQAWAVKSDRWAFLARTLTWPKREDRSIKRGGGGEGSVEREGSSKGYGIRSPLNCLGGNNGFTGKEEKDLEQQLQQQEEEQQELSTNNRGGVGGSQV